MSVRLRKIVAYSLPEKRGEVLLTRKLDLKDMDRLLVS